MIWNMLLFPVLPKHGQPWRGIRVTNLFNYTEYSLINMILHQTLRYNLNYIIWSIINSYQRLPCKAVLSMFCSNHVQNKDMEHVLVHVLFLSSLKIFFQNMKTWILEHEKIHQKKLKLCSKIMFRTRVLEHGRTYFLKNHVPEHKLEHREKKRH